MEEKKQKQCLSCGSLPNLTGGRLTRLPILGKSWELNRIYPEFLFVYLMWQFFIKIILMFFSGHLPDGLKFMFRSYLRKSEICLHIVWWKGFMIFEVSRLISVLSLVGKVVSLLQYIHIWPSHYYWQSQKGFSTNHRIHRIFQDRVGTSKSISIKYHRYPGSRHSSLLNKSE